MVKQMRLTEVAWRVLSILEEANDQEIGRSLAYITDNLREKLQSLTITSIDASSNLSQLAESALSDLIEAGFIEEVLEQTRRYRLATVLTKA